jgi:hypothetical protein
MRFRDLGDGTPRELEERVMIAAAPPAEADLAYLSALQNDAAILCEQVGFDDRFGRKRLPDLVHEAYLLEFMVIVQYVRWLSIGLLSPDDLPHYHPDPLMEDLRRRIRTSPKEHIRSAAMDTMVVRMASWWQTNTVWSAWRHLRAHVQTRGEAPELADAIAGLLWGSRHILAKKGDHQ